MNNVSFCANCGKARAEGARFCHDCGSNFDEAGNLNQQRFSEYGNGPTVAPISIVALVFSLIFPIVGIVLGLVAKSEIEKAQGAKGGQGLAVSAIIISSIQISLFLIGVIIYAILLSSQSMYLGGN